MVTRNATALHDGRHRGPARSTSEVDGAPNIGAIPPTAHPCTRDPDRWTTTSADDATKALCRTCPGRWFCAQEACKTPGAEGVWAGILIPEAGRGRQFALKQLRSLAEFDGRSVRGAAQ